MNFTFREFSIVRNDGVALIKSLITRSRSRSPNEKKWLPSELKQHLEFSLVDTTGMTEEQLKEIPYTVVQTSHARHTKLRTTSKHKQ